MDIEEIREIIKNWAMRESLIRKAYIFGSRAREDYRSDSEIDVVVQLNKLPQDGSEYSTWMYTNKELTGQKGQNRTANQNSYHSCK
ncbi:MAG: nucleotidyltransferase domain-containing protein [Candidatus Thiodiazotropha sp.]